VHAVLLDGKGLTIERPDRSTGLAVGAGLSGFALLLALVLLAQGFGFSASFAQFLAYAGAAVMAAIALAFGFWTYACATLRYEVGAEGIAVRWGPIIHRISAGSVRGVTRGRGEQRPRIAGLGWPGYHIGRGEVEGLGRTMFLSTHRSPEDVVYLRTEGLVYALSPSDPDRFVAAVERAMKGGVTEAAAPSVERHAVLVHPIWADRVAKALLLTGVLMNAGLWAVVLAVMPSLSSEITIEFPPVGDVATLQSREEILEIPATATAFLAVNVLGALLFHVRERAATYLLLSGSIFFQAVFWVAAAVAIANA
jgi:hypothetical protein